LTDRGLDAELTFVGEADGRYLGELRDESRRLGLTSRVRFVPYTADVADRLADSDIFLMCSRSEALGRVTVEACKAGVAVVGYDSGGTSEILEGGIGVLVEPGDVDAMTEAVARLLRHPEHAEALRRRSAEVLLDEFTNDQYLEGFRTIVRQVVSAR
jgi:glycosyltransferase involved in cell wall biosynthesis